MDTAVTLLPSDRRESDKSDVTYSAITNDEFMTAIFGALVGEQRPVTCGFVGHPNKVPGAKWFGQSYILDKVFFSSSANNYFTLASFTPDGQGQYRRKKKNFAALHAVMLDDIGTKAEGLERLTLPPSWLLETSQGNFQAGYIFSEPLQAGSTAERLVKAIIAAGLCDPGADGPLARYARLPVGVNGKHEPPFQCRLADFSPGRRYTVEEIVDGLQLDFNQAHEKSSIKKNGSNSGQGNSEDEVFVPRTDVNPVIEKL